MTKHRYEQIVEQIQRLIQSDNLRAGDRLPSERMLAETFMVSRNSVREAIRALAEKGILVSRLGDGTYLAPENKTLLADTLAKAIGQEKEHIKEIFELRRIIEPQVAALAATRRTSAQIQKLKAIVLDQSRATEQKTNDSVLDKRFHQTLAQATKNNVLFQVLETLSSIIDDTRSESQRPAHRSAFSVQGHMSILEAVEKKDAQAAQRAMEKHIIQIEQTILGINEE